MGIMAILSRYRRLIAFSLIIIVGLWLLYILRTVLLPFILGLALVYILLPAVTWAEQRLPHKGRWLETKRVSIVVFIYILLIIVFGLFILYIGSTVISSLNTLIADAPQLTSSALQWLGKFYSSIRAPFPTEMQTEIDTVIQNIGMTMGNAVKDAFGKSIAMIPSTIGFFAGFAFTPFFVFYLLKDWVRFKTSFKSGLPGWASGEVGHILQITGDVLGRYLRGLLLLGVVVGTLNLIGYLILQVPFAGVLALITGMTEMIPIAGPWIGGVTAVIITLAFAPEKAIWVAILALAVQLLENTLLVPRIQGRQMHIHPAMTMVLIVVGTYFAGIWGLFLTIPVIATLVEIFKHLYREAHNGDPK